LSEGRDQLTALMKWGADFLGTRYAIMAGAMSWVSERHLVSAISNAGGFGVIACGAMTVDLLDKEIAATKALTHKPFGVNLITMHPDLDALIDLCGRHRVGHVVLAGGLPPGGAIERIKSSGAKLICFAPALALAKKLIRSGVDALVIEGSEAGGHIGPVSTSVLAQEILPEVADQFRCRHRIDRASQFQESFLPRIRPRCRGERADRSAPAGHSRARAQERFDRVVQRQAARSRAGGALRRAVIDGDVEHGSLMAGQSVGMVTKEEPVADIIAALLDQAAAALDARAS